MLNQNLHYLRYLLASGGLFVFACLANIGFFALPIGVAALFMYLSALVAITALTLTLLHQWKWAKLVIIFGIFLWVFAIIYGNMILSSLPSIY
jgi:hypothetical protein